MRGRIPCAFLFVTIASGGPSLATTGLSAEEPNQPEIAKGIDWNQERDFWSFRPPSAQARPVVRNGQWPSQPLDYFVLARLEQTNLSPSPEADPRTLVRRATFDLTGLPPTPEEVQAHQVGSDTTMFYPQAYRYREWVINAFNRDLPYDQFIRLQLASDKIDGDAENFV